MLPSTSAIQEEIIAEFQMLEGDRESMLSYIMDLGEQLLPLDEVQKNEHNMVKGCLSKVWLTFARKEDCLFFKADSNTAITKGLISLLLRVFSGQRIDNIVHAHLYFVEKIGMGQLIGSQRMGGLANMIKNIKMAALAQKTTDNKSTFLPKANHCKMKYGANSINA